MCILSSLFAELIWINLVGLLDCCLPLVEINFSTETRDTSRNHQNPKIPTQPNQVYHPHGGQPKSRTAHLKEGPHPRWCFLIPAASAISSMIASPTNGEGSMTRSDYETSRMASRKHQPTDRSICLGDLIFVIHI